MAGKWRPVWSGFIVGSTMIVPGVSGGSMAMILGIYDRLISAVSSFRKKPKENFMFLMLFAVSAVIGMFLFSFPLSWLLEHYKAPTIYFFVGAVLGGVPMIAEKAGVRHVDLEVIGYMLLGTICVLVISGIPVFNFESSTSNLMIYNIFLLLIGGISAVALILPGISISHFLLVLGVYNQLINALQKMDVIFLGIFGAGIIVGICLITKGLEYLLNQYPKESYLIILGFILGSVVEILPGISNGGTLVVCVLTAVAGFAAIYCLKLKLK